MRAVWRNTLVTAAMVSFVTLAAAQQPQARPKMDYNAAAQRVLFSNYTGEFAQDSRFIEMRKLLLRKRAEILESIHEITGLPFPQNFQVHVNFVSWAQGGTYGVTTRNRINYYIGNILRDREDPVQILQHEMMHAYLIYYMGGRDRNYPLWLHEGIASLVGGHGPRFTRRYYLMFRNSLKTDNAEEIAAKLFNGIGVHASAFDYAEDFLGLLYFQQTWGAEGFKAFIRDITVGGVHWQTALMRATKMDWAAFSQAAKNFSIHYIQEIELSVNQKQPAMLGDPQ